MTAHPPAPDNSDDLLITKIKIPALTAGIVRRSRLTKLLDENKDRQGILLVAPTGYGKTTLLVDWLSSTASANRRTVWVTLDALDNTPFRFWSYLVFGFRHAFPHWKFGSQQLMRYGMQPEDLTLLNPLINEIAQIPHQVYLILDDYQTIHEEAIHRSLEYLINHQPSNLHLLIAGRVAPPILLSRQLAQRHVVQLTACDLSFTYPETNTFLSGVMGLKIDANEVAFLHTATEGWIAGLQLAAFSFQNRGGSPFRRTDFPFSQRQINKYLVEEVLNHQEPTVKDFLLSTSILPELSPALCDAILDRTDSQGMLDRIERENLFIQALDEKQQWYRYHPLFAEALQAALKRADPGRMRDLHRKAYLWLRANGYSNSAIAHALAAGDIEVAAEIVDSCALQALIDYNLNHLTYWISHISADLLDERPQLYLYDALANVFLENMDLAESKLQALEQVFAGDPRGQIASEEEALIRLKMAAIRAVIDALTADPLQVIPVIRSILEKVPQDEYYYFGCLNNTLANVLELVEDDRAAAAVFDRGGQFSKRHGLQNEVVNSSCQVAECWKRLGRLSDAEREYQDALQVATEHQTHSGSLALAKTGLLGIALERNQFDAAEQWAQEVADHIEQIEEGSFPANYQVLLPARLVQYYCARGELEKGFGIWTWATKTLIEMQEGRVYLPAELIDTQVTVWIKSGKCEHGKQWLSKQNARIAALHRTSICCQIGMARISLAQNQPDLALPILEAVAPVIRERGIGERELEGSILQAVAHQMQGNEPEALAALGKAVQLAEPEGYVQKFVGEGKAISALLLRYRDSLGKDLSGLQQERLRQYVQKLIAAFEGEPARSGPRLEETMIRKLAVSALPTPLTSREIDVLNLLSAGKSVKEIAASLTISTNTAKAHVHSIYEKLDVHDRSELAQRSRDLGIWGNVDL